MKTITKQIDVYTFDELDEEAKEKVREWYLDDPIRVDIFTEDVEMFFKENFPCSELKVNYSIGCCQGDGLNIYGKLNLTDFLDIWEATEKEKRTMQKYIDNSIHYYEFCRDNHYCYSRKYRDENNLTYTVNEFIMYLKELNFSNIKEDLITKFYKDMIDYFTQKDKKFEQDGYKWFYEADDEEIKESCDSNEWLFTQDGKFYC